MKVVTGVATVVRHSAEVSGNYHGIGTSQVLGFRVGLQSVQLSMPTMPQIEEGDGVTVAGHVENGVLIARAYRNLSNNAYGKWSHGWLSYAILTAIFFGPAVVLLMLAVINRGNVTSLLFMCCLFLGPCISFPFTAISRLLGALQTGHANRLVRSY